MLKVCIADIPPVKKTVPAKTLQLVRTVALMAIAGGWFFAFYRHDILSAVGQMLIVVAGAFSLSKLERVPALSPAQRLGLQATFWIAIFALPLAYLLSHAIGAMGPIALVIGVASAAAMWWKINVLDQQVCEKLRNKASALLAKGDAAAAEPVMKKALNQAMQLKANRDETLAVAFQDLAGLYTKMNRWAEAQEYCLRAITTMEEPGSAVRRHLPQAMELLGRIHARQRNFTSFETILDKCFQMAESQSGAGTPEVAAKLIEYARLCEAENRPAAALKFYSRCAGILMEKVGPETEPVAMCRHYAGQAAARAGLWVQAVPEFQAAEAIYGRVFGPGDPKVAPALQALGETHLALGSVELAMEQFKRALAIREDEMGPTHPQVGRLLIRTAECYLALGKNSEAGRDGQRAVSILERTGDAEQHGANAVLAQAKAHSGDIIAAERLLSRAVSQAREAGLAPAQTAAYIEGRAELMQRLGRDAEAQALERELREMQSEMVAA